MGWDFSTDREQTKAQVVSDLNRVAGATKLLAHRTVGNHLWQVVEHEGRKVIVLQLLSKARDGGWGHKSIMSYMHPYYYDCPLALLDMCEGPFGESETDWRRLVREHHAAKEDRKLVAGAHVLWNGQRYLLTRPAGPRKGWIARDAGGKEWRLNVRRLAESRAA